MKTAKAKAKNKHNFKRWTGLSIAFTLITLGYMGYRVFAFAGSNGIHILPSSSPKAATLACAHNGDEGQNSSQAVLLSRLYQQKLQATKAQSGNLIANSSLRETDADTGLPLKFSKASEEQSSIYSVGSEENTPFLRVQRNAGPQQAESSWVADMTPVEKGATYRYSLSYRSAYTTVIMAEYTVNGERFYDKVTTLDKSSSWQQFTAHFYNTKGADSFRFTAYNEGTGTLDTKDYTLYRINSAALDVGTISVTFDDGWDSVAKQALPLLNKYGVRSTQFIVADAATQNIPGYMNFKTLKKLHDGNHEIASHSLAHCDMTALPATALKDNATNSKHVLEDKKLGPIKSFAYPYGAYNQATQDVFSEGYTYVRTSDAGYNDRYFDPKNIRSFAVLHTTDLQEFKSWLEYAKTNKVWLVIAYHRIEEQGAYSVTTSQLEAQLRLVQDSQLRVLPMAEVADSIHP